MQRVVAIVLAMTFGGSVHAADDEHHSHPTPEKLGTVTFPTSCQAAVLLGLQRPDQALHEFQTALTFAPGRREALQGAIAAAERLGDTQTATLLRTQLTQ